MFQILVMGSMSLIVSSLADDNPPTKRNIDYAIPSQRGQSRRISSGSTTNLSPRAPFQAHFYDRTTGRHQSRVPSRRNRPQSLPAPPYAVQMEPLVQYSQRDPLYHQKLDGDNVTKGKNDEEKKHSSRIDNEPESSDIDEVSNQYGVPGVLDSQLQYDPNLFPHYYKEPEPIIEIIIKESNESLPAPPNPHPTQSTRPTKEPVEVFYVKYKKNPVSNGKSGEEDLVYEPPIPALTPPTNIEHEPSTEPPYELGATQPPPPPTTTLRTIIRPDSEIYHGSGLRVTFGEPEIKNVDPALEEQSAPEPSIALPTSHFIAQKRDSTGSSNTQSQFKRQPDSYQPIPHEQVQHQNIFQNPSQPLSTPHSSLQPGTYQTPPPPFQPVQYQQQQKQQVFTRQAQQQPPAFRPQHTSAIFPQQSRPQQQFIQPQQQHQHHQQQHHHQQYQQQYNQRQQIQQSNQGQPTPQQTRQNNQYTSLQQPTQVPQQRPTFRATQQNQQQFEQQKNFFPNQQDNLRQKQFQQLHQPHRQQQNVQLYRSQPIHVQSQPEINNQFNRQLQHQIKPQPLPSKPIHPAFAAHYQQQFSLQQSSSPQYNPLQQQRLNPQQQHNLQQDLLKSSGQPSSTVQPQIHFPQHQQNQKQVNKNGVQVHNLNFPNGEIIPSIPQLEEHVGVPTQYNQQQQKSSQQNLQTQYNNQQVNIQQNQQVQYNPQLQTQVQQNIQTQVQIQPSQSPYFQQNQQSFSTSVPNQSLTSDLSKQQLFSSNNNHQHQKQTKQPVYTTAKPTEAVHIQTKPSQTYSSTSLRPTEESVTEAPKDPQKEKEFEQKKQKNLAALPDEVPEDIREQLLSSGILGNADIQILDYDKVGDIPIESLPPEALENFYGAGSAPVPVVIAPNSPSKPPVEMKVVHYDPTTKEGQKVEDTYIKEDATQLDSVVLNDSRYNRYLPLKVSGANFPLPDVPQLKGRLVNSVVVLAPVDYDFVKQAEEDAERTGRAAPVQVQGVRFIAGDILKQLIKNPTTDNYKNWLAKEKSTSSDKQSVVLLVTR